MHSNIMSYLWFLARFFCFLVLGNAHNNGDINSIREALGICWKFGLAIEV